MNATKIDWCDCTVNPVVGCPRGCPYCYAKKMNDRFKFVKDFSKPEFFINKCHSLIDTRKKDTSVFINSMSDISEWDKPFLKAVLIEILHEPHGNIKYIALTKNFPKYIMKFVEAITGNPYLEANFQRLKGLLFVGITITQETEVEKIANYPISTDFINIEPILEPINLSSIFKGNETTYKQMIIGAETGNRKGKIIPKKEWIDSLVNQSDEYGIRVFMKESLRKVMGADFRQDPLIWNVNKTPSPRATVHDFIKNRFERKD